LSLPLSRNLWRSSSQLIFSSLQRRWRLLLSSGSSPWPWWSSSWPLPWSRKPPLLTHPPPPLPPAPLPPPSPHLLLPLPRSPPSSSDASSTKPQRHCFVTLFPFLCCDFFM
ncbi:unnamed protein product, partial [Musa acuminata var. zebrina]